VWLGFVCLAVTSCTVSSSLSTAQLTEADFPKQPPDSEVVLKPGDTIEIKFRYWPELDTEQKVRSDGKITLQTVGHIKVAGLTPELLDAKLVELYRSELKDPEIATFVRSQDSQQVYVGGEVRKPGLIDLKPEMTVLEAIMAAGGFDTNSAELSNIVLVRQIDNKRYATAVDFKDALNNENDLLYVAARDIVYVPRSRIDEVDQWVDQHITKLIPSLALRFLR
jgi:protein involved in polysaccharide export with SLBB domain